MKKQILFFAAAATLAFGAAAVPSDQNPLSDGPPQAYGNSGFTPDKFYGEPQPRRGIVNDGRYLRERELERQRIRAREIERQRERDRARMRAGGRDRDGDGIPNRYDRRPDNPYRN